MVHHNWVNHLHPHTYKQLSVTSLEMYTNFIWLGWIKALSLPLHWSLCGNVSQLQIFWHCIYHRLESLLQAYNEGQPATHKMLLNITTSRANTQTCRWRTVVFDPSSADGWTMLWWDENVYPDRWFASPITCTILSSCGCQLRKKNTIEGTMCGAHSWANNLHLCLHPWRLECYLTGRNTYFHPLYKHSIYRSFGCSGLIHKLDESLAKMRWREYETKPPRCSAYYSFHCLLQFFRQGRPLISETQQQKNIKMVTRQMV